MKGVLIWLKSNPITVLAGLVILVSLGFAGWAWSGFGQLREDLKVQAQEKDKLARFGGNITVLPAAGIDEPPVEVTDVTYNPPTVGRMKRIFSDLNNQTELTIATFATFNQRGHQQLVEGYFPAATGDTFNFKNRYRDAVQTLLAGPGPAAGFAEANGVVLPTLQAGLPPRPEELQPALARIADEGARALGDQLTEEQAQSLQNEQKAALLDRLTERARGLDVYANPDIGSTSQLNPEFPLPVMRYVYEGTRPEAWQLWESQLQTWILQDVIAAVGLANGVEVPGTAPMPAAQRPGGGETEGVLGGVVKRILSLEVLPGYVGLHTLGGVGSLEGSAGRTAGNRASGEAMPPPPVPGAATEAGAAGGIPTIRPNHFISPTGRSSNPVFDVRHSRLRVHLDYARMPVFLEALARVNFISVVDMKLTAIDPYDYSDAGRLGGLFVYGTGQMMEADLVLESLWFRSWTAPLMPTAVRAYLGIPEPGAPESEDPSELAADL